MTPHGLIAAFDTLAEAPDGLTRLRELVFRLAVRGKLVPQDPEDEPASMLLDRITAGKAGIIRKKKTSSPNAPPPISKAEVPFEVPVGWSTARLGDLGLWVGGKTPSKSVSAFWTGGIPWVSPKDMKTAVIKSSQDEVSSEALAAGLSLIPAGSILIVVRSGILRHTVPVAVTAVDCTINQDLKALLLPAGVPPRYVSLMISGFQAFILEHLTKTGTTVESLKFDEFSNQVFPLPPLAEQKRIVARVDELMGLLDRLEAARNAREATRTALRDASLVALRDADTPEEVEVAWDRIAERMDDLFTTPADVDPLRQTVLQLAVRGRLVPQNPNDEPASALLERIAAEKALLVKEGKLGKQKPIPPVTEDEAPFDVADGWSWCRLGCLLVDGPTNGWSPKSADFDTGVRSLKLSATTKGVFDVACFKFVDATLDADSPLWLRPGDLLIQRSNTPEYVGMAAVYDGGPREFMYPDLMMRCRLSVGVEVEFVHKALVAPAGRQWFRDRASGTSQSMVKVNQATVQATPVPVPPLAEQKRIVATLDELTALVDQLAQHLADKAAAQDAFAAAAVHHLEV